MLLQLQQIGLAPNEARIYLALINLKEASVSAIAVQSKIHRRNVYDTLHRMIDKGLVFQIFQKHETIYRPAEPHKLMEIVKEKEKSLQEILPELEKQFSTDCFKDAAYIYKGIEGYKHYRRDLIHIGEPTYFLGSKALPFSSKESRQLLTAFQKQMRQKKIPYYSLYDPRVMEIIPEAPKTIGGKYKILPKSYATPGVVDIFGDHIVTFAGVDVGNFGEDGTIFVMVNRELAESYRTWFKFMWDMCPSPIKK